MDRIRQTKRLGDELYRSLSSMIESLELPEGARLPPELELADKFGVSRPTVRETLARLRDEGLIASRRGSGSFVQRRPAAASEPGLTFRNIDSFEQIRQSYAFRLAIEGEAAFHAAKVRTDDQLAEIARAMAQLDRVISERVVGAEADFRFHQAVAVASGNSWFVAALLAMRGQIEVTIGIARALSLNKSGDYQQDVQTEHAAIYESIRDHDGPAAKDAMRRHLTNTCDRIFRGPASWAKPGAR